MSNTGYETLSSNWGSLNPNLLAAIYPVDRKGWRLKIRQL